MHTTQSISWRRISIGAAAIALAFAAYAYGAVRHQAAPLLHAASVDYFLKIDGVDGESTDAVHKGEIDIDSFSWGITSPGNKFGGGGAGKAVIQDFVLAKKVDKSSPALSLSVATGKHYKKAVLTVRNDSRNPKDYYVITMEDVLVSSYQVGGSSGTDPKEQVSLSFGKVKVEYKENGKGGEEGGGRFESGWDLEKNKQM